MTEEVKNYEKTINEKTDQAFNLYERIIGLLNKKMQVMNLQKYKN